MYATVHEQPYPIKGTADEKCCGAMLNGLRRLGVKQTRQRTEFLQVFLNMKGHPSPEKIYEEARRKGFNLGMATIYRTLKLLVEAGLARRLDFGDGQGRYERLDNTEYHLHLVCQRCGKIIEVPMAAVESQFTELAEAHSFALHDQTTVLHGLCKDCLKKMTLSTHDAATSTTDSLE